MYFLRYIKKTENFNLYFVRSKKTDKLKNSDFYGTRRVNCLVVSRRVLKRQLRREVRPKNAGPTKATTTKLVSDIFDSIFQGQLDDKVGGVKRRRCGVCEVTHG